MQLHSLKRSKTKRYSFTSYKGSHSPYLSRIMSMCRPPSASDSVKRISHISNHNKGERLTAALDWTNSRFDIHDKIQSYSQNRKKPVHDG